MLSIDIDRYFVPSSFGGYAWSAHVAVTGAAAELRGHVMRRNARWILRLSKTLSDARDTEVA
jgi:hypothetical protein